MVSNACNPESPSKAVIELFGDLESMCHISVTPGLVRWVFGPCGGYQHVERTGDIGPETALASVHLVSAVLDGFIQGKTQIDSEVVYSEPEMDVGEINCNETELTETQRAHVKGLLHPMSYIFASGPAEWLPPGQKCSCGQGKDGNDHTFSIVQI